VIILEIKVNDYARTKWGEIAKIKKFAGTNSCGNLYQLDIKGENNLYCEGNIIKISPRIIDLIEVGDYVDKLRVVDKYEDYIVIETFDERIVIHKEDTIKSIVTKEMFEQMEYKIN
jgi:hypothetical protein